MRHKDFVSDEYSYAKDDSLGKQITNIPSEELRIKKIGIFTFSLIIIALFCLGAKSCTGRNSKRAKSGSSNVNAFIINSPSNLTATAVSYSQINLSWQDNSNNEDGFEIERSIDGTNYLLLTTIYFNATSYSDMVPPSFAIYYYRIRVFNTIGDRSNYSNIAGVTVLPPDWLALAAGFSHSLALASDGTIWSWGGNLSDQLGMGDAAPFTVNIPTRMGSETDWRVIAAGYNHTLSIKTNRTLWSWGDDAYGQLGIGTTDWYSRTEPVQVGTDSDWLTQGVSLTGTNLATIAGGDVHSIALKTNRTLWSWGYNDYGQLGLGTSATLLVTTTPTQIGTDFDWSSCSAGGEHTIAIKTNNTLWAWGWNYWTQLGDGTNVDRGTPRRIGTDSDWSMVSAGYSQSIALKTTGSLWEWGYGSNFPQRVGFDTDWFSISAGGYVEDILPFNLVLKTAGTLWSWGSNNFGQLGLGDNIDRSAPVQIPTPVNWKLVAAGGYHALGVTNEGRLWSWGRNNSYQLGLGTTVNRYVPIDFTLPRPTNLIANVIDRTTIALLWNDNSSSETGFIIESREGGAGDYTQIAAVGPNITSYLDTTVNSGNTYYYRVKAIFSDRESLYSNIAACIVRIWEVKIGRVPVRTGQSMVCDPVRNVMIMFGGQDNGGPPKTKNDLWWYDPSSGPNGTWIKKIDQDAPGSPSARRNHDMVWDPVRNVMIMFGGNTPSILMNDLWWYDPSSVPNGAWTKMIDHGAPGSPSGRIIHSMVWDGQRVIMFGGVDEFNVRKNDLWWYDPASGTTGAWIKKIDQDEPGSPLGRMASDMVWDGQRVIMFGGYDLFGYKNDLWWYDPSSGTTGAWVKKIDHGAPGSPLQRTYHSMVWDPVRNVMIMFGGTSFTNDLWWYDPSSGTTGAWTKMIEHGADVLPSPRYYHSMVWDPVRNVMIMFGGRDMSDVRKNDLWWYDSSSGTSGAWIKKIDQDAPGSPSARSYHSVVWDPVRNVMIMFGGYDGGASYKNDLWWYYPASGTTGAWIKQIDQDAPGSSSGRESHSMVWDPVRNVMIMFGGYDIVSFYTNDLWWYDPASGTTGAWIKKIDQGAPGSPSARRNHSVVWDPVRDLMIMFGGNTPSILMNDLWWYDPSSVPNGAWTKKIDQGAPGSPSGRYAHSMIWDPGLNVMIMFGGQDDAGYNKDLWWW